MQPAEMADSSRERARTAGEEELVVAVVVVRGVGGVDDEVLWQVVWCCCCFRRSRARERIGRGSVLRQVWVGIVLAVVGEDRSGGRIPSDDEEGCMARR